jgi:transcriptional/translational regulatory protein YebC/TACO1
MMAALEAGADDIDTSDDEIITVLCEPGNLETLSEALRLAGYAIDSSETTMAPSSTIEVTEPDNAKLLLKLLDVLENHEDVQQVYANFDMDSGLMQEAMV